jgi:hypothetical protein
VSQKSDTELNDPFQREMVAGCFFYCEGLLKEKNKSETPGIFLGERQKRIRALSGLNVFHYRVCAQ